MCVLLITRLLRGVGRWARKPVNHTSWVAVVTPTDHPKSVRNCCLIELFCGVVCVVTLPFWHFCWCRGFCHRTGSDLLLFVFNVTINNISVIHVTAHSCAGGLKNKLDLRSGSQRHRHFVGFFNMPVSSTDMGPPFLYGDSDTPPHLVAFYDHAGDTEDTFST